MPRHHQHLTQNLPDSKEFVTFPSDKNLGPCIVEYETYIKQVFNNHLLDASTYKELQEDAAKDAVDATLHQIEAFLLNFGPTLSSDNHIYMSCSLNAVDPFARFYITAKVHKTPWKTQPIVSVTGSITHKLGLWINQQLQPISQ
jgi:hypothetical protein